MKPLTKMRYMLWGLAEKMDWDNRPPRKLWKWLLKRYDVYFGVTDTPEDQGSNWKKNYDKALKGE